MSGNFLCDDWCSPVLIGNLLCPAEPPAAKPSLKHDETIINPYYMRQLLSYGIKLGQQTQHTDMDPDELLKEAEVRLLLSLIPFISDLFHSAWWRNSRPSNHSPVFFAAYIFCIIS